MTLIIKNANLYDMKNIWGEPRNIVIENKKIKDIKLIADKLDEDNAEIIDANNKILMPGLIEPNCSLGLVDQALPEGNDRDETSNPICPELRAIDAINPYDLSFKDALNNGVTTVISGPGNKNLIGGTFTALKTNYNFNKESIIEKELAYKFSIGIAPKKTYNSKGKSPITRLGNISLIREALNKALEYKQNENHKFDLGLKSLARVFDGMLVKVEAIEAQDIVAAVNLMEEFKLNYTIDRASESYLIPEFIKKHNVKLILGPVYGGKRTHELLHQEAVSGKILEDNKIEFATSCGHPTCDINLIMENAIMMYRKKMSGKEVLKSLTINAAKRVGLEDRIGSIEVGKDADLILWDGNPLDYYSNVEKVIINGEVIK